LPEQNEKYNLPGFDEPAGHRARSIFTLAELIAVLVIIAVLAAITIPVVIGYVQKAEDRQVIARARNVTMAMRSLLDEIYAAEGLHVNKSNDGAKDGFLIAGRPFGDKKFYFISDLSGVLYGDGDGWEMKKKLADLMGESLPRDASEANDWDYCLVAENDPSVNAVTADAFFFIVYPEGSGGIGKPIIIVTHNIAADEPEDMERSWGMLPKVNFALDAHAGYQVYRSETSRE
jgi:hypothetical protein